MPVVVLTLLVSLQQGAGRGALLNVLVTAGLALVIAVVIHAVARQSEERQAALEELAATRAELADAARRTGILEERQRLARALHDTVAQAFTSVVTHLEAADQAMPDHPDAAGTHLDTARRTARDGLTDVRVLIVTTYDEDHEILRAIEAGAAGYLFKDTPRDDLFRAVRAAARGEAVLGPVVAASLLGRLRAPGPDAPSDRELEVLALVARGMTNRAIARALSISEATVKTHLVHVFGKLGVDDRTAAVTVGLRRGLIRLDHPG